MNFKQVRNLLVGLLLVLLTSCRGMEETMRLASEQTKNAGEEFERKNPGKYRNIFDPYEEVFDGATVYKICETGSYFNSMLRRDDGGRGYGVVLDGRSMTNPDKLPYRELQRLKNLMRNYCPEALYIK